MLHRSHRAFTAAALCLSAAASFAEVPSRVLDKETFFQMESVSTPVIAPDGSQIVFTRGFVDTKKDATGARRARPSRDTNWQMLLSSPPGESNNLNMATSSPWTVETNPTRAATFKEKSPATI